MTVLVTGFEPFKGLPSNPSALVAEILGARPGFIHRILPVTYVGSRAELTRFVAGHPDAELVLSLGLWDSGTAVRVESTGRNVQRASIPDNAGDLAKGRPVDPYGPDTLSADERLVKRAYDAFESAGVPAVHSDDAGGYICNTAYYTLLQRDVPGIFIHIPLAEVIAPETIADVLAHEFSQGDR
ncbi:MAG: pyroglutamyl-peptidase I [Propionibacteriaceae bacterium]|jgi:pyroglutamyl-peptidase|nr:pyroglutamyl-peptidase I [Propionibacteriaceae bacterium]